MSVQGAAIPSARLHAAVAAEAHGGAQLLLLCCRISPLSYVQRAVAINEFDSARWGGSEGLGRQVLTAFSEPTGFWWVWLGVGVLVAFIISMNVLVAVATSYLPRDALIMPDMLTGCSKSCCSDPRAARH